MSVYIHRDIEGINYIRSSLKTRSSNLTDENLNKIIANLSLSLINLESHLREGFTPLTEEWKPEIIESLNKLKKTIGKLGEKQQVKIQDIKNKILEIQATIETVPSFDIKKPYFNVVPIVFFCDLDCPDFNNAIRYGLENALEKGETFITTRSLLRGEGFIKDMWENLISITQLCLKYINDWEIYQKGELLIFIPKTLYPKMNGEQKLQVLNFKIDDNLKRITVTEALSESQKKATIHDFIDLFHEKPRANQAFAFLIHGHGDDRTVGGLSGSHYLPFVDFLDKQQCKGLVVWSCSAAGISSLLNIADPQTSPTFFAQEKPHSFPTLVCSIGDFNTSLQPVETQIKMFMSAISSFIETSKGQTFEELRKKIDNLAESRETKVNNFIRLYPAHSADISWGFRPIGEGSKSFNLTYTDVKKAGLNIAPNAERKRIERVKKPKISVTPQTKYLNINPLVTPVSIIFEEQIPVLLSMIPGTGHHFIKLLELVKSTSNDDYEFIKEMFRFYYSRKLTHGYKNFFIGEIRIDGKNIFHHVVFKFSSDEISCVWQRGNKYFMGYIENTDKKDLFVFDKKEISSLNYAIFCYESNCITKGLDKAIRSISAGRESESDFQEAFEEANFYPDEFRKLFDLSQTVPIPTQNFPKYFKEKNIEDKHSLILFLTEHGNAPMALKLFNEYHLDSSVNFSNLTGNSILSCAIQAHAADFVERLLKSSYIMYIQYEHSVNGDSPLNQTVKLLATLYEKHNQGISNEHAINECEKILDLLKGRSLINDEDKKGWPVIVYALPHRQIVEKLMKSGASLTQINLRKGHTPLGFAISKVDSKSIDLLLDLGVIPDPNSLCLAIQLNDMDLFKKLLAAGGKPFETDSLGKIPFFETIYRSPPEIVRLLIERDDCDLNVKDKMSIALLAALSVGNKEKLQIFKEKKAVIPNIARIKKPFLEVIIHRYAVANDIDSLKSLFEFDHGNDFEIFVANYLQKAGQQNILNELIKAGCIKT